MKDLFIRRVYTSYGISVVVELDFVKKTVSFTDKEGKPKSFKFAGRTPEYLNGWRAIMKAMDYATAEAHKEMTAVDEIEHREFVEMLATLDKALKKNAGSPDEQ